MGGVFIPVFQQVRVSEHSVRMNFGRVGLCVRPVYGQGILIVSYFEQPLSQSGKRSIRRVN